MIQRAGAVEVASPDSAFGQPIGVHRERPRHFLESAAPKRNLARAACCSPAQSGEKSARVPGRKMVVLFSAGFPLDSRDRVRADGHDRCVQQGERGDLFAGCARFAGNAAGGQAQLHARDDGNVRLQEVRTKNVYGGARLVLASYSAGMLDPQRPGGGAVALVEAAQAAVEVDARRRRWNWRHWRNRRHRGTGGTGGTGGNGEQARAAQAAQEERAAKEAPEATQAEALQILNTNSPNNAFTTSRAPSFHNSHLGLH